MNDKPNTELLSAYLDGELTAAEQAEVEQLLAATPAARQLLDELRELSSTLQDLPAYTVGEDLSERVLRMAERQILSDSPTPAEPRPCSEPAPTSARSIFRRLLRPRTLVWPAAAVAVAVVFIMIDREELDRPAGRQVATTEGASEEPEPSSSLRAPKEPTEEAMPAADEELALEKPAEAERGTAATSKTGPPARDADLASEEAERADRLESRTMPEKPAAMPGTEPAAAAPAAPKERNEMRAKVGGGIGMKKAKMPQKSESTARAAKDSPGRGGLALKGSLPRPNGKDDDRGGQSFFGNGRAAGKEIRGGLVHPAENVVVIDLSGEAVRKKAFEQVLSGVGIDFEDDRPERSLVVAGRTLARTELGRLRKKEAKDLAQAKQRRGYDSEETYLVWVEATPAQIEATLADLAQRVEQAGEFVSVWDKATAGAEVQQVRDPTETFRRSRQSREALEAESLRRGRAFRFQFEEKFKTQERTPAEQTAEPQPPADQPQQPPADVAQAENAQSQRAAEEFDAAADGPAVQPEAMTQGQSAKYAQSSQPAPTQRVLFVLRVVESAVPAAAAAAEEPGPAKQ